VYADIDGDAAGPFFVSLPGYGVPGAPGGYIGEHHVAALGRRRLLQPITERQQRRVHPELQHRPDPPACFLLQLLQGVQVPRVDD